MEPCDKRPPPPPPRAGKREPPSPIKGIGKDKKKGMKMKGAVRAPVFTSVYGHHHHQKEIERRSWNLNGVGAMDAEEEAAATTMTV
jgi:hypothetical protein